MSDFVIFGDAETEESTAAVGKSAVELLPLVGSSLGSGNELGIGYAGALMLDERAIQKMLGRLRKIRVPRDGSEVRRLEFARPLRIRIQLCNGKTTRDS